jgi:predicted metal-dependent phosphoesterase TrpH
MNDSVPARATTMRIDLHCHTEASHDCRTPLAQIPQRCREKHLDVLAVTDHNQIWGALQLQEILAGRTDLTVIVGEEVSTREGELIGLFLHENISAGMSPEQTVGAIRDQGGLVLLPHGFDPLKAHRLKPAALERIVDQIDIVEVFNARVSRPAWNRAASTWAQRHHRAVSAGSDAHLLSHIGGAWVEAPYRQIVSKEDLLAALREGKVSGNWTHPAFAFVQKLFDVRR